MKPTPEYVTCPICGNPNSLPQKVAQLHIAAGTAAHQAESRGYDGVAVVESIADAVGLLAEVQDACLFDEDDGKIGVTTDVHIDEDFFNRISALLAKLRRSSDRTCPNRRAARGVEGG